MANTAESIFNPPPISHSDDKKVVLLVEDDREISMSLCIRLRRANYKVLCAFDTVTCQALAAKAPHIDLAIFDITMPGGDGFLAAERLQKRPNTVGTPFMFITASKLPEFRERAQSLGCCGYFEKPYDSNELMKRISEMTP